MKAIMISPVDVVNNNSCEDSDSYPSHQKLQKLPPHACCLGIDGELWDVSNLSCSDSISPLSSSYGSQIEPQQTQSSRRRSSEWNNEESSLYPPRDVVKDIPDDHDLNSIFKEVHRASARDDDLTVLDRAFLRERFLQRRSEQFAELHDIRRELHENALRHKERQRRSGAQRARSLRNLCSQVYPSSSSSELRDELDSFSSLPQRHYTNTAPTSRRQHNHRMMSSQNVGGTGAIEVEVTPGHFLPLRGAVETERAAKQGRVGSTVCSCCTSRLYCILTAEFVLCPHCRIVCPVGFLPREEFGKVGGVGLGMAPNDLQQLLGSSD